MTENRISQTELIDLIVAASEIPQAEVESFVRNLFELISETLINDELVKIKDFGTFKLTPVQARESVDVNTGDKIEIPAHNKISFSPATALRELVNKPFAHFESVLLNEGVSFDNLPEFEPGGETEYQKLPGKSEPDGKEKNSSKISQSIQYAAKELENEVHHAADTSKKITEKPMLRKSEEPRNIHPQKTPKRASYKRSPLWIPVLGGTAIALAALFFLRTDNR